MVLYHMVAVWVRVVELVERCSWARRIAGPTISCVRSRCWRSDSWRRRRYRFQVLVLVLVLVWIGMRLLELMMGANDSTLAE